MQPYTALFPLKNDIEFSLVFTSAVVMIVFIILNQSIDLYYFMLSTFVFIQVIIIFFINNKVSFL